MINTTTVSIAIQQIIPFINLFMLVHKTARNSLKILLFFPRLILKVTFFIRM